MRRAPAPSEGLHVEVRPPQAVEQIEGDARTAKSVEIARNAGMRVIYVVLGFRVGDPEVSPRNQSFGAIRERQRRPSA